MDIIQIIDNYISNKNEERHLRVQLKKMQLKLRKDEVLIKKHFIETIEEQ